MGFKGVKMIKMIFVSDYWARANEASRVENDSCHRDTNSRALGLHLGDISTTTVSLLLCSMNTT